MAVIDQLEAQQQAAAKLAAVFASASVAAFTETKSCEPA